MRPFLAVVVALVVALVAAPLAARADPAPEATYDFTVKPVAPLKAGAKGQLVIAITPKAGVPGNPHVSEQAPLQAKLASSAGLRLAKEQLGRADAKATQTHGTELTVAFDAVAAGKQQITGKMDFFVCTDKWCLRQERDVTAAVDVK